MKRHAYHLAFFLAAALVFCLLGACAGGSPSTLKTYDFGRDKVPSITSVVGERTVTGVATEGKNEFPSKQYTYQSSSVIDDLGQYFQLLPEQGWITAGGGYNLEESAGSAQFVKESADSGQILTILVTYEENSYTIGITKLVAEIANLGADS